MSNIEKYKPKELSQIVSELTDDENHICESLNKFNQLREFPLSALQILEWKDTILEARPNIDPEAIRFIVDKLITADLPYSKGEGILNIFRGLKLIDRNKEGYIVKSDMTW